MYFQIIIQIRYSINIPYSYISHPVHHIFYIFYIFYNIWIVERGIEFQFLFFSYYRRMMTIMAIIMTIIITIPVIGMGIMIG